MPNTILGILFTVLDLVIGEKEGGEGKGKKEKGKEEERGEGRGKD